MSASTVFAETKAFLFVQMTVPQVTGGGDQWKEFNAALKAECVDMIVYLADPNAFRLLTVEADDGPMSAAVAKKLADEHRTALNVPLPSGGTVDGLSNVAFYSTADVAPVVRGLFEAAGPAGQNLMANISGSAYDVPKVLDFMLRVSFEGIPVVRFDQDNIISSTGCFQTEEVLSVVKRACAIYAQLDPKDLFAYSSRYDDPAQTKASGLDYCSRYSTRPNPALKVAPLLSAYDPAGDAANDVAAKPPFGELTQKLKALEEAHYACQVEKGVSKGDANKTLFLSACDDEVMNGFYDALDPYIKKDTDASNVLSNAAISGAGLVLSPGYCKAHAPFLNFGKFDPKLFDHSEELDAESRGILEKALLDMDEWGKVTDGKLMPTVMWIDDQITCDFIVKRGGHVTTLKETHVSSFVPKSRAAPGMPLWYTLEIYCQTLLSGFILKEVVTGKVTEVTLEIAKEVEAKFAALFSEGSIGHLFCQYVTAEKVLGAMTVAQKEFDFWQNQLNPCWENMCSHPDFIAKMREVIQLGKARDGI